MKLGIMQPYFFPYIGYFSLIANTDLWVVFDTPQYTRKSWMNRNRILHPRGWTPEFRGWMNLPQASETPSGRETVVPEGYCFFMGEPEEFVGNNWHGEVALLYVDADGSVVPCCQHPMAGVFGNLKRQTYNEIMNGETRRRFRHNMTTDRSGMAVCSKCDMGPPGREGPSFTSVLSMKD